MTTSTEPETIEEPDFAWGKKRGVGEKNREVRFYETFTYDGEDYALYDNVFMYKAEEPEPYIGKIVRIWESSDKSKKVKIQWFFRPREISHYLGDAAVVGNELFFASGGGTGLSNICPLEAIAGKCNIVCISKDGRNPQPSVEEFQRDHYVFYRVFDVKSFTISDHMDDKVGGIEVQYVFNRTESHGSTDARNLNLTDKDEERNLIACGETSKAAGKNSFQLLNNVKPEENDDHMLGKEDTNAKEMAVKQVSLHGDSSGVCVKYQGKLEEGVKRGAINVGDFDGTQSKKAKLDGTTVTLEVKDLKSVQSPENDAAHTLLGAPVSSVKSKSEFNKNLDGSEKDVKLALKSSFLDENLSKTPRSGHNEDLVGLGKNAKGNGSLSRGMEPSRVKDSVATENDNKIGENLRAHVARPPKNNGFPNEKLKSGSNKDFQGSLQAAKGTSKRSADLSNEKSNTRHDVDHGSHGTKLTKDPHSLGGPPTKKKRFDDSVKILDEARVKLGQSSQPSQSKLPISAIKARERDIGKVESRIFEATRRPIIEKGNWMKLSWESKMKVAHDKGTLVLLQNLDPEYTSGEVEDIVFHAFNEECTAKTLQHTATSNPYSGQALVVLNSREAVDRVMKRLEDGCLLLPNQRPLVVRTVDFPKFSGKQTLVGHLAIDKSRRQIQRDTKEAVATSHYSQNNTIEYEMAMAWCLLQARSDKWWNMLYEQHRKEMQKLVNNLKSKTKPEK